jgi:hypothetical protein
VAIKDKIPTFNNINLSFIITLTPLGSSSAGLMPA